MVFNDDTSGPVTSAIVQRQDEEYAWWHARYTTLWHMSRDTQDGDIQELAGIIKATRDMFLTYDGTLKYLEDDRDKDRLVARALRRIRWVRRLRHLGSLIVHVLEWIGSCICPPFPGSAPR